MIRILSILIVIALNYSAFISTSAQTQPANIQTTKAESAASSSGTFTKKRYAVKGGWELFTIDGKQAIRFKDDFKTKSGPDLKVYLSPKNLANVSRKTATQGSLNIGVLKSNKGSQTYIIPDDVELSDYESVLVHCEAYSVLWGGFDIPK